MIRKFKFDYYYDNYSLFLYDSKLKSKASVEIDDLIIDYNKNKEVSAIELLNVSNFFKDISSTNLKITKKTLNELSECKIQIIPKGNFFIIKFDFTLKSKERLFAPIYVPTILEPSPATVIV